VIHLCNNCGCKDAESFDAEYSVDKLSKMSFREIDRKSGFLGDRLANFGVMDSWTELTNSKRKEILNKIKKKESWLGWEAESFDAEYDEEDMVYCNHCSDIVGNEKEVYGDETVDYEMASGELVCVPCYKIWMKEYENDLDPNYSPFYAESNFDKLANKIAAQYKKKGKSAKEAMKIGKATAYKIGARKYGKAGMARKARAGMRAEGFEGESPMMKNITAIGVLVLAILAGKKLTR